MKRLIALAVVILAVSCSKKEGDSGKSAEGGDKAAAGESGGGDDNAAVKLADLDGLTIDVAKGTEPSKMGGDVMIMSMNESFTVRAAKDSDPKTADDAKKEVTDLYKAKNIKDVTVDGGWGITFENTGSAGENYWLSMRREVAGKAYWCSTSVGHKSLRDGAVKACKSLRK